MGTTKMAIVPTAAVDHQVSVSTATADPAWDEFLESVPGGHHSQSSLWAQIKAFLGWRSVRVIVRDGTSIVAGGQILFRRARILGTLAYVAKGPVMASDDADLADLVIEQLREVAAANGAHILFMQPPNTGGETVHRLPRWGFRVSPIETGPTATVLVDLSQTLDDIMARMRKGTRKNVRRSARDRISVREGTEADLSTFHRLLVIGSQRRGFVPFQEEYFWRMWRSLAPHGYLKLFLAERKGEAVSAQLVLAFGDTAFAKQVGWSGYYGGSGPNEALDWATIKWAKSRGYKHYDLEGIDPTAVRALERGEKLPNALRQTPTFYKLGWGGQARLLPQTYCYLFNPLLRIAYNKVSRAVIKRLVSQRALSCFRTRGNGHLAGTGQHNEKV
jgi:lipid II:glycine glycyltransferase (peptidoglycan interpeptide bridge formation enzyme)